MLVGSSIAFAMSGIEQLTSAGQNVDNHAASVDLTNPALVGLTDGTGANKAQKVGFRVFTLSTTPTDIDLTAFAGGIGDAAINFTKIKQVFLRNLDAAIVITVGGTAGSPANAWVNYFNGTIALGPGAISTRIEHTNGIVVASNNKLLRVVAASGTPQLQVFLIGEGS